MGATMGDEERMLRLEISLEHMQRDIADIKSVLGQLVPMIARIESRIADMPTARDFGRLEGRVAEMSERLPTMIGYNPPEPRRAAGG
jgi:hypothetical protein